MLKPYIQLLMSKTALNQEQAKAAMSLMLEDADPYQIAAFLTLLKYRGETAEEVAGMALALQSKSLPAQLPRPTLDIVGTGGDLANTVNISTGSAILAAACGIPIAKHGNRASSSKSGSADVLEALEIDIEVPSHQLEKYLQDVGIAFMFAPYYNPTLKKLSAIRKGLKFPTVCNILGPLLNPARSSYALIGVANLPTLDLMSQVMLQLGEQKRTLIFHGCGLDELTTLGKIVAFDIHNGIRQRIEIDPADLGFTRCALKDLEGGDAKLNASLLKDAFSGKKGALADALTFNAGAAVWVYGCASTLLEGIHTAREVLKEGGALRVLEKWVALSKQMKLERVV